MIAFRGAKGVFREFLEPLKAFQGAFQTDYKDSKGVFVRILRFSGPFQGSLVAFQVF